jgi:hypothetical protein
MRKGAKAQRHNGTTAQNKIQKYKLINNSKQPATSTKQPAPTYI